MRNMLAIIPICTFLFLLVACGSTPQDPAFKTDLKPIEKLPDIEIQLLDSSTIALKSKLPNDKIILLYYFDPYCQHCEQETKMILKNTLASTQAYVSFLSNSTIEEIKRYDATYNISGQNNTLIGKDIKYSFTKYLNQGSFPLLVMYDKKRDLKIIFPGSVSDAVLSSYLERAL